MTLHKPITRFLSNAAARKYIDGVTFHWYAGDLWHELSIDKTAVTILNENRLTWTGSSTMESEDICSFRLITTTLTLEGVWGRF